MATSLAEQTEIARSIERHWHEKGHFGVRVKVVKRPYTIMYEGEEVLRNSYEIVSNLVNGKPAK